MVARVYENSTQEGKAGGSRVQGRSQLHSELKASLSYLRTYTKQKAGKRGMSRLFRVCIVLAEDLKSVPSRLASEGTSTHVHTPTQTHTHTHHNIHIYT